MASNKELAAQVAELQTLLTDATTSKVQALARRDEMQREVGSALGCEGEGAAALATAARMVVGERDGLREDVERLRGEHAQMADHLARIGERLSAFEAWCQQPGNSGAYIALVACLEGRDPEEERARIDAEIAAHLAANPIKLKKLDGVERVFTRADLKEHEDLLRFHHPGLLAGYLRLIGVDESRAPDGAPFLTTPGRSS